MQTLNAEWQKNTQTPIVVITVGSEWEYVVLSMVRSLPESKIDRKPSIAWKSQNLGFICDEHQINVALTRAKEGMIILGNWMDLFL